MATCLEKPHDFTNHWIVSRHEELALTDPDVVDVHGAGSKDRGPEVELLAHPQLTPGAPETTASGANKVL